MSNSPAMNGSARSENLFGFVGTLGRSKKRSKEVEELNAEGRAAIDGTSQSPTLDQLPEDFVLNEQEERRMLQPGTMDSLPLQELIRTLVNWINDELSELRIIVRRLDEDLYDGQILGKLVERLGDCRLDVIELTLNEDLQRAKLRAVLDTANRLLGLAPGSAGIRWTVEAVHDKDLVQILHLLIAFARHFRAPVRLPPDVQVRVVVVQKCNGKLQSRVDVEQLTGSAGEQDTLGDEHGDLGDEFDRLHRQSKETVRVAKQLIYEFVSFHLYKLHVECERNEQFELSAGQFSDGLLLIFLMGMCEGYFVPLGQIFTTPNEATLSEELLAEQAGLGAGLETQLRKGDYVNTASLHKLHNVNVAFQLMQDAGIEVRSRVRAEDVVNADAGSIFRVLFMIHSKYKDYAY